MEWETNPLESGRGEERLSVSAPRFPATRFAVFLSEGDRDKQGTAHSGRRSERLSPLRDALDRLGFTVIPSAQNYPFAHKFALGGRDWDIKVDLLAKTPDVAAFPQIKMDEWRIKPNPSVGLHAHRTDEAIAIEEGMKSLIVTGVRSNGEPFTGKSCCRRLMPCS